MATAILHLLPSAQPEGTGVARIVAALAARLDPAKYHVHAWFLGASGPLVGELQAAGATARSVYWWRGIKDPIGAFRFWTYLRKYDFAIVHHHFGGRCIRRLVRLSSHACLVVHLHQRIPRTKSNAIAVCGADVVIAVSRAVALQIRGPVPVVVYPGAELRAGVRAANKMPDSNIVVGAACRLVDIKGLSNLIQAVAVLRLEFSGLQLEIAGTGPESANLKREVLQLGLTECVHFLGWQCDLGAVLRRWDIFALPSLTEGLPMAALEAMAEGLPVVATHVGGLPELVEHGQTGYLVPPSDVAQLVAVLRLLILDPKRRRAMGAAGRDRARNLFSLDRMVAEIEAIYDSLIQARK